MRLTQQQTDCIRNALHRHFGLKAEVWLFGSRVDDRARGGDIDLLILPETDTEAPFDRKVRFLVELEQTLGERRIDVVIEHPEDPRPIVSIAHQRGVKL